ncbi:hypothetical protein TL16_g01484 [Triparma laevis f. inornata]|uniref:Palmitoyltransferase n=1 Tax=Triparma laevis f. inornata TaxID=1714386 RepID=A0A9W6ZM83_9STRA|nr:hypothetical protein TL16_g01484 [Triparma laevis f. inornata]
MQKMTLDKTTDVSDDDGDRPLSPSELDLSSITADGGQTPGPGNTNGSMTLSSPSMGSGMNSPLHGTENGSGDPPKMLEESLNGDSMKLGGKESKDNNNGDGHDGDPDSDNSDNSSSEEESSDSEDEGMAGGGVDTSTLVYKKIEEGGEETYTLAIAASQGNLPISVLLWGMYQAAGVDPLTKDSEGNSAVHYAVLADTFEVLDFIMQQTGGYDSKKNKLIDTRNSDEETPLIRASTKGNMNMIKALIRYGADLGAMDTNNNTIIMNASKNGHLWIVHFLLSLCPPAIQETLLSQCDIDGHTPVDWACYKGHTNVAEYLMFRGIEPTHLDNNGRNCLHWAAKQGQVETAAYLVALGMDPHFKDKEGSTAAMFSLTNYELFDAILANPGKQCGYRGGATMGEGSQYEALCCGTFVAKKGVTEKALNLNGANDIEQGTTSDPGSTRGLLSIKVQEGLSGLDTGADKGLNPALMRANPTRMDIMMVFATAIMLIWAVYVFLPAWASVLATILCYQIYTGIGKQIKVAEKAMTQREGRVVKMGGLIPKLLKAHEAAIGFWLGCALVFFAVCVVSLILSVDTTAGNFTTSGGNEYLNTFVLLAESARNTPLLFYVTTASIILMIFSWWLLVFVYIDPGCVYANRNTTYTELLAEVATGSEPDSRKWCSTTLVKKPMRAKFDAPTGLLIARHDHYCVWLDTAVGFGNHRVFMVFVFFQVLSHVLFSVFGWWNMVEYMKQANMAGEWCKVVEALVSMRVFGMLSLTLCANACTLGLGFLLAQQSSNMLNNISTNERINAKRYPWLQDDQGRFLNRYDLGSVFANLAEFWGKKKDYRETYELPEIRKGAVGVKEKCCDDEGCEGEGISLVNVGGGAGGEVGGHNHAHNHV